MVHTASKRILASETIAAGMVVVIIQPACVIATRASSARTVPIKIRAKALLVKTDQSAQAAFAAARTGSLAGDVNM